MSYEEGKTYKTGPHTGGQPGAAVRKGITQTEKLATARAARLETHPRLLDPLVVWKQNSGDTKKPRSLKGVQSAFILFVAVHAFQGPNRVHCLKVGDVNYPNSLGPPRSYRTGSHDCGSKKPVTAS